MYNRKNSEAAQRFAERRRREDEAPRLHSEVPRLRTLRLDIEERSDGRSVAEPTHVRHVVVASAPALFLLPCGDPHCKDGGHDITHSVVRYLRAGEVRFEGEDSCSGSVGTGSCARVLHFVGVATYE